MVAVYIPPLNVAGDQIANVLAAVGEQSDKPLVSTFLGSEGVPELLRVPDVAGSTAGRGSVPSYQAVEGAVRALAKVVEYAVWLRTPDGATTGAGDVDTTAARQLVGGVLAKHPDGAQLDADELTGLLASYGIELWPTVPVTTLRQAQVAGKKLGWDVVLKATAEHLRERPDLAHVWRNVDTAEEMKDAWNTLRDIVGTPDDAGLVVQKNAPPGVPMAVRSIEDPLFGPVVSFGISGPLTELLGDKSYRIPPLGDHDAAAMVREIRASPMLFGYRGSEIVDIAAVERLILRVARLQHDLPQIASLELSLVLAGAQQPLGPHRGGPDRAGRRPALGLVRPPDGERARRHDPAVITCSPPPRRRSSFRYRRASTHPQPGAVAVRAPASSRCPAGFP